MRRLVIIGVLLALLPMQAQALSTDDLLALVAMPLAVAAVSEVTGVPQAELANLVATLNNANVPPAQFIEVIRYVPVALVVENDQPDFVQFVQEQTTQGVTGPALVTVIERRLRTIDPQITVVAPAPRTTVIVVDDTFIPARVRQRVTSVTRLKTHPHGGPPGQVKKQLGLKTGAEVVHGRRGDDKPRPMVSSSGGNTHRVVVKEKHDKDKGRHGGDKGKDHGKGKGKDKGKD